MTTWFVSRHPGAVDWAQSKGVAYDRLEEHLEIDDIASGDIVIGSLPVNLAAEVCMRGAEYWNLSLRLAPQDRGRELTAEQLHRYNATIERYEIRKLP